MGIKTLGIIKNSSHFQQKIIIDKKIFTIIFFSQVGNYLLFFARKKLFTIFTIFFNAPKIIYYFINTPKII